MRQRVTFIHKPGDAVKPASVKVAGSVLIGPDLEAAREERLTLALDELPRDLRDLLSGCHELHIRWASPRVYQSVSPLFSRTSPGLHVFYTPQQGSVTSAKNLCPTLRRAFGDIDCSSPDESFTALSNERFSQSTAFQYYQPLESLAHFVRYAEDELCSAADSACVSRARRLADASSIDISFDTIAHAVKATAIWPYQTQKLHVTSPDGHRTEVGILGPDQPPNLEPHELGLSGLLTVLGTDSEPSPTMFAFPSRHRHSEATFSARFLLPTGLHPTLQINVSSNRPPSADSYCSAHAYLTLPRSIFADKYQLADNLFLASKNLTALRFISQPVDLEAPEYAVKLWGSALLLELSPPTSEVEQSWTAEVPLHLRYLAPAVGGYDSIEIPYPVVLWACAAEEGTKFPTNPFERVNVGYDGLFGPRTVFWHVDPLPVMGNRLMTEIRVPVLDTAKADWVGFGTGLSIFLGFAWVVWKLAASLVGTRSGKERLGVESKKTQ